MSNVSRHPCFPLIVVIFIFATFLQISITQMILMTGRLIRIRQTTLSPNSNSQILAPQSGMWFTCFLLLYVHGVWQRVLSPLRGDTPP